MKTKIKFLIILLSVIFLISGCKYFGIEEDGVSYMPFEEIPAEEEFVPSEEEIIITGDVIIEEEPETEVPSEKEETTPTELPQIIVTEGVLVSLESIISKVEDPDKDTLIFTFSEPLNEKGEWQTKVGDAGKYVVAITVSDGKAETKQDVEIVVQSLNKPPVLETIEDIAVNEGDTISFDAKAVDPDNDPVTITYSGWMTSPVYATNYNDAGIHTVAVKASDGKAEVIQNVKVTVNNVNRAPELEPIMDIAVLENEKISIEAKASDPDGDKVTLTFSAPLDEKGEWQTKVGDSGKHRVTVTASDGVSTAEREFYVVVQSLNKAPEINKIGIELTPKTTYDEIKDNYALVYLENKDDKRAIRLTPDVSDADGDDVTVTYSGWMSSSEKTVGWDVEGGSYKVTVTASDGKEEVSKELTIEVNHKPQFY